MTDRPLRPPSLTRRWLRRALPSHVREFVVGDLDEEFVRYIAPRMSRWRANQWYRSQAIRSWWRSRHAPAPATDALPANPYSRGTRMAGTWQDIRFALRASRRQPGFALLVLVTLGLGVGATAAIFSAVNDVMLRPLPYAEPERLVMLWESNAERGWGQVQVAPANALDWRARVPAFADVALLNEYTSGVALEQDGTASELSASLLTGNAFSVLGTAPLLGRTFTEAETWEDAPMVVVLSYEAWTRYFNADSAIVGATVRLDAVAYQVVGIMPQDFRSINDADLWMTYRWSRDDPVAAWFRRAHIARAVARLRDGVSLDEARAELAAVAADLQGEHPELNRGMEAGLTALHPFLVGDRRMRLLLLFAAVLILQLLACANVANLLLVRSVARRRELAVRSALGAGRGRVVRQILTECFAFSLGGTVLGIGIAVVGLNVISAFSPPTLAVASFHLDWRLLAFTALVTGASTVIFGAWPALRSARIDPSSILHDGSRTGTSGRGRQRATGILVVAEIGLAVMLVIGAGLLLRSLQQLREIDPGVNVENVLTFQLTPPQGTYPNDRVRAVFYETLAERTLGIPGVEGAGVNRHLPFQGWGWSSDFSMEGWASDQFGIEVRHRAATPSYFEVMGIPVLDGRLFNPTLGEAEAVPVVVNQAFKDRYFPDESPVGRRIAFDRHPTERSYWYPIVGVVGNERLSVFQEPLPEIISHIRGDTPSVGTFVVKTSVPPLTIVPDVQRTLAALDPGIPLVAVRTMRQVASDALAEEQFLMGMLGVFALVALGMAGIGVYGVAAQAARFRTREIGIRLALGAPAGAVVRLLVMRGAGLVFAGLALGIAGAAAGSRAIESLLYGVTPLDPRTLAVGCAILAGLAMVSSYLPARRAIRLDPASVLRAE